MNLRDLLVTPLRGRLWRELAWVLLGVPLTLLTLLPLLLGLLLGVVTTPLLIGLLLLGGCLLAARTLGAAHRRLARGLLGVTVPAPRPAALEPGLWRWIRGRLGDAVAWRCLAYLVLRLPLSLAMLAMTTALVLYGVAGTFYTLWRLMFGDHQVMPVFDIGTRGWPAAVAVSLFAALLLVVTPVLVHVLTGADRLLARGLLGPVTLSERVRDLEASRAVAVDDATARLRRIERDLHDGAQAHLVALTMKLGIAADELAGGEPDPDRLRTLVSAAHGNATRALAELRDLARGIHPPALDAGLDVALRTLTASAALPVSTEFALARRAPVAVETIAYFTAAELLANAGKYGAGPVDLAVSTVEDRLRLVVTDQGPGGAEIRPGGGLAGLVDRVGTVDGHLEVDSPAGGPTVVTVHIPL
ncbi:sensor histidine kinase [Amycolatopsis suaedae]|uniref:histidine kinase n=1 Tax=Amycolatopsis suaedae TaxID=2510978 RepID=A0A4Q7JCT4_9PSEU|nr:sensor domain-containing protein [Amycolatopsis suaedae]RZQ64862.1 sensor histidine kinase [Amycolatopsis suaedae]